ncbi:MAG: lamin tail domain-containing protein [Candidatus Nanohaloarchaea archaeon]
MPTMYEAAMAASLIVGLVSIPAASQSLDASQNLSADLPEISSSQSVPREVVSNTSAEGFTRSVETAFNSFRTSIESDSVRVELENPSTRLTLDRKPGRTTWELTTSRGKLELVESSARTVERTETPSGTLVRVERGGKVSEKFRGTHREEVEKTAQELRDLMEQQQKEVERRQKKMARQNLPEIELVANKTTADEESGGGEYVILVNTGRQEADLENWVLSNQDSDTHSFGQVSLMPGERLYVYNNGADEVSRKRENAVYGTGLDWDMDDTASLQSSSGMKVEEVSY